MTIRTLTACTAGLLLLAFARTAAAMPIRDPGSGATAQPEPDPIVVTRTADFGWAEAAIGAGVAFAVCALLLTALALHRRTVTT